MSGRVIVVGSVNIDFVARVPHLPHPGETVTGGSYQRHNGGKGGNQAIAAARLRRPTLFIGAVGDDTFASEAKRALSSERVDISMVASLRGQPTGVALILVDSTGENEIAVVPGANGAIEAGIVRENLSRLGRLTGDVLLVSNEVPIEAVREALMCAHAAGATTILNPAPAVGIERAVFGLADIITPNRTELATLLHTDARRTGHRTDNQEIPDRARPLLEDIPGAPGVRKAVIVTLGACGVVVLERPGSGLDGKKPPAIRVEEGSEPAPGEEPSTVEQREPAETGTSEPAPAIEAPEPQDGEIKIWDLPAEKVTTVDSTGAGDAFNGALAAAIAEGKPFREAVQRAVAAGALATTRVGAREGMPTAAELEEFLSERRA